VTDEPNTRADELHESGMKLSDAGDQASAIQEYLRAPLTAVLKGWAERRRRVADLRCTLDARLS
jgi:hypothetical protein